MRTIELHSTDFSGTMPLPEGVSLRQQRIARQGRHAVER